MAEANTPFNELYPWFRVLLRWGDVRLGQILDFISSNTFLLDNHIENRIWHIMTDPVSGGFFPLKGSTLRVLEFKNPL